jgi:hypothetical protein
MIRTLLIRKHIKQIANRSLEWLRTHESDFRISRETNRALPWRIKPLMELMFLLSTLKRHGIHDETLNRLTDCAVEQARQFDWHELAAYDPSTATPLALVADFFSSNGQPAPFDYSFFDFLTQIDFFEGMDRLPYREMDLAHSLGLLVSSDYEKTLGEWFSSTAFGRNQQITRYTIDDLYSLTHAVFYLTDMGLRDLGCYLSPAVAARLRATLWMLPAMMLRGDNVDVLGELILCWIFCRVDSSPLNDLIFDQALHCVLAFATPDGAVAPTINTYHKAKSGKASFTELYHTTLVAALLLTLLSRKYTYGNRLVA